MRKFLLPLAALVCLAALPSTASAAPYIGASNVKASCHILPDGTVATVCLVLDPTTGSSYGTQLYYHFVKNPDGNSVIRPTPSPSSNPVRLAVDPGHYLLTIENSATHGASSSSPIYQVTVPAFQIVTFHNKRMCIYKALQRDHMRARP